MLEKDNFSEVGPFLTLCSVRNGPSVSFGTNIPWNVSNFYKYKVVGSVCLFLSQIMTLRKLIYLLQIWLGYSAEPRECS